MSSAVRNSIAIASFCLLTAVTVQAKEDFGKARIQHKKVFNIADGANRILRDMQEQSYELAAMPAW